MDGDRFDAVLRLLTTTPSRRRALRLFAGAAVGGWLGIGQRKTTAKKGKGKGHGKAKVKARTRSARTPAASPSAIRASDQHLQVRAASAFGARRHGRAVPAILCWQSQLDRVWWRQPVQWRRLVSGSRPATEPATFALTLFSVAAETVRGFLCAGRPRRPMSPGY